MRHRLPLLAAGALLAACPLPAQIEPVAAAFRDSIGRIHDLRTLRELEERTTAALRLTRGERDLDLRLAFVVLRIADATRSVAAYDRAITHFDGVTSEVPQSAAAWFGLGLSYIGYDVAADAVIASVADIFSRDPVERAGTAFGRSITADTSSQVIEWLVRRAIPHRNERWMRATLRAARAAVPFASERRVGALVARARIERAAGSLDSALASIEAAGRLSREPGVLLELAHTRLVSGRLDGAAPWYEGLASATGPALAQYRRDVAIVLPGSLLDDFDGSSGAERSRLMRAYWNAQDPTGLPVHAERLRDHYKRLEIARREFPLPNGTTPGVTFADYTDDRGRIVILHGWPRDRAVLSGLIGLPPSESWRYQPQDGTELLFHFMADSGTAPFRRVESIIDILSRSNQSKWFSGRFDSAGRDTASAPVNTYGGELSAVVAQQVLLSRWNVSEAFRDILQEGKAGAAATQAAEREIGRQSLASPATWALGYELPLDASVSIVAVGADANGPQVQIAFAIAGRSLSAVRTPSGSAYEVRLRATVRDAAGRIVATVDTVRRFLARGGMARDGFLLGRLPIAVPAGTFDVTAALENDGRGMVSSRANIAAGVGGRRLAMSDLAVGARSVPIPWQTTTGDTAWINPLRRFRVSEPMLLHFEVSGLDAGTPFQTELRVLRKAGGGALGLGSAAMLTLGFAQEHRGGIDQIQREIDVRRLRPGSYVIEVTVTTPDGQRLQRREEFVVTR